MDTTNLVVTQHTFMGRNVKKHWDVLAGGRKFLLSNSQFGWHVGEFFNDGYKQHALDKIVYDNKTEALNAIKEAV